MIGSMSPVDYFNDARKIAIREYSKNVSKGTNGYLPHLEGILKNIKIVSEVALGLDEIPIKKITGANSYMRSLSFACNFMPLLAESTEFGQKWINLCKIHLDEGIRDPIKAYEYLNWFYVIEGNKRVSVLKYFDAYSIPVKVRRLIPEKDENDPDIKIYYEYMDFYKKTKINCIWFTREQGFIKLWEYLQKYEPAGSTYHNKYKGFLSDVYMPFRKIYLGAGGGTLPITTGDAFLEYTKIYGFPVEDDEKDFKLKLKVFLTELEHFVQWEKADVQTTPVPEREGGIISAITTFVRPKKKLKIAFAYANSIQQSNWTYAHELGRTYVDEVLQEHVSTSYVDNVPENMDAYGFLKQLAEEGNDIIFATSPAFMNATLKTALEYRNVKFFNCSDMHSFKHVYSYYGRIYEARFLSGIIAGAMTQSNALGYVGTYPIPGVISGINAFALGAKMVNPRTKVKVAWTYQWDSPEDARNASTQLINDGCDIISHQNTLANRRIFREFGVYSVVCNAGKEGCMPDKYIATPVWNWGVFYEKIIRNILNGTLSSVSDMFGSGSKLVNFWWGIDTGIVDIFYSRLVPKETQKLVNLMKRMIADGAFHPFTGPIHDQNNVLKLKKDETANYSKILSMDWFVDAVESKMPDIESIHSSDAANNQV